jgi:hypothetical protein
MVIVKHLCVVCAIESVVETFFKPKLLKFRIFGREYKCTQCFLMPIFENLVLVLALKLLEVCISLIFGCPLCDIIQILIINQGEDEMPPTQFVSNYMEH